LEIRSEISRYTIDIIALKEVLESRSPKTKFRDTPERSLGKKYTIYNHIRGKADLQKLSSEKRLLLESPS